MVGNNAEFCQCILDWVNRQPLAEEQLSCTSVTKMAGLALVSIGALYSPLFTGDSADSQIERSIFSARVHRHRVQSKVRLSLKLNSHANFLCLQ